MEELLKLENLNMAYIGNYEALIDINLSVLVGEKVVVCGKRYSGKSSLARVIAGLEKRTSGNIIYKGRNIDDISKKDRNIVFLFDKDSFNKKDSLINNLIYPLIIRKVSEDVAKILVKEKAKLFSLDSFLDKKVEGLSDKVLDIALVVRLILLDRDLYLIDEPFKHLEDNEKEKAYEILKEILKDKSVIYFVDNLEDGMRLCDEVYIIDDGKIVDKINRLSTPKHLMSALMQGNSEVYATLRKIDNEYYLDIMDEDVIESDIFVKDHLIKCNPPINDIYIDKHILVSRESCGIIDIDNYYDLASKFNIARRK